MGGWGGPNKSWGVGFFFKKKLSGGDVYSGPKSMYTALNERAPDSLKQISGKHYKHQLSVS